VVVVGTVTVGVVTVGTVTDTLGTVGPPGSSCALAGMPPTINPETRAPAIPASMVLRCKP
jgi:hypothetical protein